MSYYNIVEEYRPLLDENGTLNKFFSNPALVKDVDNKISNMGIRWDDYHHVDNLFGLNNLPISRHKFGEALVKKVEDLNLFTISAIGNMVNKLEQEHATIIADKIYNKTKSGIEYQCYKPMYFNIYCHVSSKYQIEVLNTIIKSIQHTSYNDDNMIGKAFSNISEENINEACSVLATKSPKICVHLLARDDINEDYKTKGIKALVRLSNQRTHIRARISMSQIESLSTKTRLRATKQLLGIAAHWKSLPVTYDPFISDKDNIEELRRVLFPCMMEYAEDVQKIITRYKSILKNLSEGGD